MKRIDTFEDALAYINRLGFATSGNMQYRQQCLCAVTDALKTAAGGYPYKVTFHRYLQVGFTYPWLSSFTVVCVAANQRVSVSMKGVKV